MSRSILDVLKTCHNYQLHPLATAASTTTINDEPHEKLVPFYLHLPDRLISDLKLFRFQLPTRTSNTTPRKKSISSKPVSSKPLSSYLTRVNSSDQLDPHALHLSKPISPIVYDDHQQDRDARQPIGFLRPCVVRALVDDNLHMARSLSRPCWKLVYDHQPDSEDLNPNSNHLQKSSDLYSPCRISFEDWINQSEDPLDTRQEHFDRLVRGWKELGLFHDQLSGWRNEYYSVYGPKDEDDLQEEGRLPGSNLAFKIERAAVGLFGFLSFGAHLTAYFKKNGEYFFWVPRRSPTKATWPSKLDNTAAGGITSGESVLETMIRECFEEASFEEAFVRSRIRAAGLISYTHRNQHGWIQPEIQYTYDLELSPDEGVTPRPNDGETEDFKLMNVEEVTEALKKDEFKPNCAAVLVDFFIRHGLLTPDNERNFGLVATLLKQTPFLPLP